MAYTDIDKPSDYFETILYSGNGGTQSITSLDFQPDWCWLKARAGDNVSDHRSVDSVRSATKELFQNATAAEETNTNGLTAFNSNGFSLGSSGGTNNSNTTYASWNWKAGTSFTNDASSTSVGSIDSAGSVNTDAGFSIITYSGTNGTETVAHGLGVKPKMIIFKYRNSSINWLVYHASLGATKSIYLDDNAVATTSYDYFADTEPTSSVFTVKKDRTYVETNNSGGNYVTYCFAEKQGYSKFNKFVGTGNVNGSYIHLGFSPAFVMVKNTSAAENWIIFDNKRPGRNLTDALLKPNLANAESTSGVKFDLLSNGFKARVSDAEGNSSGHTFIYMAFAENPFVTSTGVPATAR